MMQGKAIYLAIVAAATFAPLLPAFAQTASIEYRLEPEAASIGPDETPGDIVLSVKSSDGGQPLDARLHITLTAPDGGLLIGTDFPIVEGTRLVQASGQTVNGELRLSYLFPIRGEYHLQVRAEPSRSASGSQRFEPAYLDARFSLSENPGEVWNFIWMALGLLVLGIFAGFLLGRDALPSAGTAANAVFVMIAGAAIAIGSGTLAPSALHAHGPVEPPPEGYVDFAEVRDHGYRLRLKMLMRPATEPQDASAEQAAAIDSGFAAVRAQALANMRDTGAAARVGDVAYLVGEITNNGRPVPGAKLQLSLEHLEDHSTVFATSSTAGAEAWVWGQQFFDGAPHRVELKALMADGEELTAVMNVDVEGLSPPGLVILRALLVLLAIVAAGMALGYWLAIKRG